MSVQDEKTVSPPSERTEEEGTDEFVNEKALIRKLDWRLIPSVTILYLLSFLDRANGEAVRSYCPSTLC